MEHIPPLNATSGQRRRQDRPRSIRCQCRPQAPLGRIFQGRRPGMPHVTSAARSRRGRGESGDRSEYSVAREIEDIAALYDVSGGGALALEAACVLRFIYAVAVHEAPYDLAPETPQQQRDYVAELDGRRPRSPATAAFDPVVDVSSGRTMRSRDLSSEPVPHALCDTVGWIDLAPGPIDLWFTRVSNASPAPFVLGR